MIDRADLHTHSVFSDGKLTPSEIVKLAEKQNLGAIALTDHDTLNGLSEFLEVESNSNMLRVPGVEISTQYEGLEIHMLGYYPSLDSIQLKKALKRLERSRVQRLPKMCDKLSELGIEVSKEIIAEEIEGVTSPGRPHLARILVKMGVVDSIQKAFDRYLRKGGPAYVKKDRMNTIKAIRLLREVHSIPVMAHPLLTPIDNLEDILRIFKEAGLMGIEVEYEYGSPKKWRDNQSLIAIAKKLDLLMTGGSDSHGDSSHSPLGSVTVSKDVAIEIQRLHLDEC